MGQWAQDPPSRLPSSRAGGYSPLHGHLGRGPLALPWRLRPRGGLWDHLGKPCAVTVRLHLGFTWGPPESEEERTGVVGTLLLRPPLLHPTSQPRSAMNRGAPRGSIAGWFQEPQLCPASPGLEPCSVRGSRVTSAPVPLHSAFQFPRLHSAGYSPSGFLKSGRWQLSD